ncbi:sugar ABC transporter permease [Priestia megaterium]|uniref:carbohydrate ABC transporter permease n=1 Tax=Priestia megaterium TaxID=1404 RepID=UPI000BF5A9E4|nr:sugar ABC transporter permease [Priestia megaterium]PFI60696.1 sugar ABC transporter permease [Priestia megaterium]PFL64393.1 sugar ABC transporter permease [Priestia megaterium]PFT51717.1 sugar ABC transporter permease [Priestia megaterium]PFV93137.1 sugar ABC transporter permease [Priestia megaterium]
MNYNKKAKWLILFGLLPGTIIYLIVAVIPIFISLYLSFFDWNGLSPLKYIGFENYKDIFTDSLFWNSVKNNIYIIISGLLGTIPLGLGMALLLNRKLKGIKFFRMALFLPIVISAVIISLIWGFVFNSEYGLINSFLDLIGLSSLKQNWLGDPSVSMISICITYIWANFGFYFIIFLAAIQTIPKEIIEASQIDGANAWQRIWNVILPSIKETLIVAVIFSISNSFRAFDLIFAMTGGGPANSTDVMTIYMYQKTFLNMNFGYGSAVSIIILLFSLIVIVSIQALANKEIKLKKKRVRKLRFLNPAGSSKGVN